MRVAQAKARALARRGHSCPGTVVARERLVSVHAQASAGSSSENGPAPSARPLVRLRALQPLGQVVAESGAAVIQKVQVQGAKGLEVELLGLSPLDAQRTLTTRVKAARSIKEFLDLLAAGGKLIDSICLAELLTQLPKVLRSNTTAVASTSREASHTQASTSAAQSSGLAKRLSDSERQELNNLLGQLVPLIRLRLKEFDAQGLVTVAVGLVKLGYTDNGVFQLLAQQSRTRLGHGFTPSALAGLIWALAMARVQPCGSWLSDFYRCVERQVDAFSLADLASLLWGLASFDLMPEPWLMEALQDAALRKLLAAQAARASLASERSSTAQDATTIITCLARYFYQYQYRAHDEWLAAFLAGVQPYLRSANSQDIVAVLHSSVCLNHMPHRLWMNELFGVLKDRVLLDPSLPRHDFSRLMWALSRCDYTPSRSWLREFVEVSTMKLSHLRARALSELVWAMACWDCRPTARWLRDFYRTSAPRLADFTPQQLAVMFSGLAKLGRRAPTAWLGQALASFCSQLAGTKSHDLVAFVESFVSVCDDPVWLSSQAPLLNLIAETAAPKFQHLDCLSHTKLVLALARARACPGTAWLVRQQAALVALLGRGDDMLDDATAANLRDAYAQWDVEIDTDLAAELEGA